MNSFILSFVALLSCICFYLIKSEKKDFKIISWGVYAVLFAFAFYLFITKVIIKFNNPEVWDFTLFYLSGKTAAAGYNYYSPENFHLVFNSLNLPALDYKIFLTQAVDVGFPYPPPTVLYFLPLGYLSYNNALIFWTILNLAFLAGCIYLMYNLFLKKYKLNGLMLILILFFIFSPVRSTIFYSQTTFIILFYLLLMKKLEGNKFAGIILALAVFVKPYIAIFLLYFIIKKEWKTIAYFIISVVVIMGLTAALFGTAPIVSYIFDNPTKRIPKGIYFEEINQSLHSVLLRAKIISINKIVPFICIIVGVLSITMTYLIYLQKRKLYDYVWVVMVCMGLLLYPATLNHYGVLLLFIIFQFFDEDKPLGLNAYLTVPVIGMFYFLSSISMFTAICFLLMLVIFKSFKLDLPFNILINKKLAKKVSTDGKNLYQ